MVLYIPNPITIAARLARGTRMKRLAFFPMRTSGKTQY